MEQMQTLKEVFLTLDEYYISTSTHEIRKNEKKWIIRESLLHLQHLF